MSSFCIKMQTCFFLGTKRFRYRMNTQRPQGHHLGQRRRRRQALRLDRHPRRRGRHHRNGQRSGQERSAYAQRRDPRHRRLPDRRATALRRHRHRHRFGGCRLMCGGRALARPAAPVSPGIQAPFRRLMRVDGSPVDSCFWPVGLSLPHKTRHSPWPIR